ncbi:MAG: tetratricopeptide repeat protein [Acidobacteriota bacterium]|nr:tetratricopeptide repeat protein [Acidobacteriota bacterium]
MRTARFLLAFMCSWLVFAQAFAQKTAANNFAIAIAEIKKGTNIGTALVRSRGEISESGIGDVVFPQSNGITRILYDKKGGTYFGYRLSVESSSGQQYRFEFNSLPDDAAAALHRHLNCPECPIPTPLARSNPQFPGSLMLSEDAICTVDLLINPQTGEKIVDVIVVSSKPISKQTMQSAAQKTQEAMALVEHGDSLLARENHAAAIEEYKKALAINPNDSTVWNKLGISHQRMGQITLAQAQFERAVKVNAKYAEAWNNLGSCYHMRGKYKEAIRYYLKAIDAKPAFAAAYKNMGSAYFAQKQFENGYRAFQAALRLDPAILETSTSLGVQVANANAAELYYYFAMLSAANKQNDTALDFLGRAIDAGFRDCARIAHEADFRALSHLPRFKQIVHSACQQPQ